MPFFSRLHLPQALQADRLYDTFLANFISTARDISNAIQHGMLRRYLFVIIIFPLMIIGLYVVMRPIPYAPVAHDSLNIGGVMLTLIIVSAALVVSFTPSRLMAIVALGVIGFAVALIFLSFGAPDLAITQFTVETLAVIVFVLIIKRLPRFPTSSSRGSRLRDGFLAASIGLGMSAFAYVILSRPPDKTVSNFYAMNSYLLAKGRNVVNVILVDFRSLDTLGEISVLLIAAVGIIAMLRHSFKENSKP